MGQLAVSLAGYAGGNAILPGFGGQVGFALGSVLGGALFGDDVNVKGPRIEDAKVTTSAYGQIVPIVWGVYPVAGNIIDASEVREVKNTESQGKGGPSQSSTTYEYFGDLDVLVCEGIADAVLLIRANGQVIFDASPDADVVQPDWLDFEFYDGAEDQPIDPTMEAIHGVGNVPNYGGTCHIVFKNFPFSQFGNQFAINFEFVVARSANVVTPLQPTQVSPTGQPSEFSGGLLEPYSGLLIFPLGIIGNQTFGVTAVDPFGRAITWQVLADREAGADIPDYYRLVALRSRLIQTSTGSYYAPGTIGVVYRDSSQDADRIVEIDPQTGAVLRESGLLAAGARSIVQMAYDYWTLGDPTPFYITQLTGLYGGWMGFDAPVAIDPPVGWFFDRRLISDGNGHLLVGVQNQSQSSTLWGFDILTSATMTYLPSVTVMPNEPLAFTRGGDSWWICLQPQPAIFTEMDDTGTILQTINFDTDYGITDFAWVDQDKGMVYEDSKNTLFVQFTNNLYEINLNDTTQAPESYPVSASLMVEAVHLESGRVWYAPEDDVNAYSVNIFARTGNTVPLSTVVSDLSLNGTRLQPTDIDVSGLDSVNVAGLGVSQAMARRNVVSLLQTAYLFDYVPRDGGLFGVLRGANPTVTLDEDTIGAYIDGGSPSEPWTISRAAGESLPNMVEVTFSDPDHNYEASTQNALRQASVGGRTNRVNLPLSLTNDEGAQVADILLHLSNVNAEIYKTNTMPSTIDDVQPGEVVSANYDNVSYTFRVVDASIIDGRMIAMQGLREVPDLYSSYAVGGSPREVDNTVQALGNTILWPMDIPMLRNEDNAPLVYITATSYTPGWPGCSVDRSSDGTSYTPATSLTSEGTMGTTLNVPATPIPGYEYTQVGSTLVISLISGALESTDPNSPSYAAWGQNGRFEIISFNTATQGADGFWTIFDISRGLFDSWAAVDSHATGDQFILLDELYMGRIFNNPTAIGNVEFLRATTIGRLTSTGTIAPYNFTAQTTAPFAPVLLSAVKQTNGNWDFSWMRQDRVQTRPFWQPPMSESIEQYEIDILDDYDNVIRTIVVNDAQSVTYSVAQQTHDNIQNQLYMRWNIYQMSTINGRGHRNFGLSGGYYGYPGEVIADGANHFWQLNETAGTVAIDTVDASTPGEYQGTYTLDQAPLSSSGKSVLFNSGRVFIDASSFGANDIRAVEFFFQFDTAQEMALLYMGTGNNSVHALTINTTATGAVRIRTHRSNGSLTLDLTGAVLAAGVPHHLIMNIDAQNGPLQIYIDDVLYIDGFMTGTWNMEDEIHFGGDEQFNTPDFIGYLDEFSLNPTLLTPTQISEHFRRGGVV